MYPPTCPHHGPAAWRRSDAGRLTIFCATCDTLAEFNELRALFHLPPLDRLPEVPVSVPEAWPTFCALSDDELQRIYDQHGLHALASTLGVAYQRVRDHLKTRGITLHAVGNPARAKLNRCQHDLFAAVAA